MGGKETRRTQSEAETQPSVPPRTPREVVAAWLGEHPRALVAAVGPDGRPVPMPPDVPLLPTQERFERSFLELVEPAEVTEVVSAFNEALQHGASVATLKMADGSRSVKVQYLDARDSYGVVLRLATPAGEADHSVRLQADELVPTRPRLAVIHKDEVSRILSIDDATTILLGWSPEEMIGQRTLEFVHPDDQSRAVDNWMEMMAGSRHAVRLRFRAKDGRWVWFEASNELRTNGDGRTVVGQMIDISDEMGALEALQYNEQLLRRLTETVPVGLAELGPDGVERYVNTAFRSLLAEHGLKSFEHMVQALCEPGAGALRQAMAAALQVGVDSDVEIDLPAAGSTRARTCQIALRALVDGAQILGALVCVMDVTNLKIRASTDPLTGLHNRASILELLESALRASEPVGVLYVDLDGFKPINDQLGHEAGDRFLAKVGRALLDVVRDNDAVGRVGGDEFVVVCRGLSDATAVLEVARRVQAAAAAELDNSVPGHRGSASVGVVWTAPGQLSASEVLSRADEAMYRSKRSREDRPVVWQAGWREPGSAAGRHL